ncbi:hypothetical protein Tco_0157446, partial [Tanacetum coccineum]
DDDGGGGGVGCGGTAAGEEGRVRESDLGDWVDPVVRTIFGFAGKIPPEKFSGGGSGGRRRRELAGEDDRRWSEEEEREAFMKDKVTSASLESKIGIDAIPTAIKPPTILKDFSRYDLIELYRLVIKKYGVNRPEEMYDRVLWGDLKIMFDPPLNRKHPLSKDAYQVMLKMKLLDGTTDEVCYQQQTTTCKEISNPLTSDSLLKTIREDEMLIKIKRQSMICLQINNKQIIIKEKLMIKEKCFDTILKVNSASTLVSTDRRVNIVSTDIDIRLHHPMSIEVVNRRIDHLFFLEFREAVNLSSKFNIVIRSFEYAVLEPFNIDDLRTRVLFPPTNVEKLSFEFFSDDGLLELELNIAL